MRSRRAAADRLVEFTLFDCDDLRDIYDAWPPQANLARSEWNITGGRGTVQVRSNKADHGCCYPAVVENVALDDDAGMELRGSRTCGRTKIVPIHLTLADQFDT